MVEPNVGEAIGLSDKPNLYANVLNSTLARQDAKEARDADNRRKAQEKEEAEAKKVVGAADIYLDPSKWHRMYSGAATKEIVNFKNDFIDYKSKNPNSWQTYAAQKFDELKGRLAELQTSSTAVKELEKAAIEQKVHVPDSFLQEINKSDFNAGIYKDPETGRMVSPQWEAISKGLDDRYGINLDKSGNMNLNLVPKTDFKNRIEAFTNNDKNWLDKDIKMAPVSGAPNRYKQITTQAIDPTSSETFVNGITTTPAYVKDWIISNKDVLDKDPELNALRGEPAKYSEKVRELMSNDIRKATTLSRDRITGFTDRVPEPKAAKEDEKVSLDATFDELLPKMQEKEQIFADTEHTNSIKKEISDLNSQADELESNLPDKPSEDELAAITNLRSKAKTKEDLLKTQTPRADVQYKMPVKLKNESTYTTVNNGDGVIDLSTNRQLTNVNQFDFQPKYIGILTVKGKKKAYVFGSTKDKAAAVDRNGNVVSDKNVSGEIAIPLEKAEKFLNEQGNPTKWTAEAIQRASGGSGKVAYKETTVDKSAPKAEDLRSKYNY